ncbi:PH domain protein [Teladorsagia circumcincta]|uniref:PH domain protein n=1 Tax=Teladorsagia circumcincta TaxID=45464 RepID=A0A2G9USV0_TELCI|nr:PH domain protein [Teladorsagia circumcincta]
MTPEETTSEEMGPILGVQCHGTLWKKYKKKNRPATWSKRFFVLKECFLIYYSTRFKKTFQKDKRINLHPKGIIPLIGCSIVCGGDVGKKHCLLIAHPQFPSAIIVAAPDFQTQEEWLKALRNATKISFKNTQVGETMIRELESKGLLLCEEKKTYEEKLEHEAKARKEEHERAAELARVKAELENEREKLIRTTKKLKDDFQNVKNELKVTNEMKMTLEQEKISLNSKNEYLQANMEEVNEQKELTESELRQQVMARIGAEKQLQAAEKALEHLEMALKMTGAQMTELQEHIMPDVHKLRGTRSIRRSKRNIRSSFRRQLSVREKDDQPNKDLNDNALIQI